MRIRAAQATTIVLFSLVMGVFWGTWFSLSRTMDQLSDDTFVAVGHQMIRNLGGPMAILLPLSLLSALGAVAHHPHLRLDRRRGRGHDQRRSAGPAGPTARHQVGSPGQAVAGRRSA